MDSSVLSPFELLRPLARHPGSVVLEVRHRQTGERFALTLFRHRDPEAVAHLREMLPTLHALRHPNLVGVHEVLEVDGRPALLLDPAEGPTLADALADEPFTPEQADDIGRGLLEGLRALHEAGLVHGRLDPRSVLLVVGATGPIARITDPGPCGGVPIQRHRATAYLSPEQVADPLACTVQGDLFSAGAILYELVTATRAFEGEDAEAVAAQIVEGLFVPPQERVPGLPERHVRAITRALRPDPDQRAQTARELLAVWEGAEESTGRVAPSRAWDDRSTGRLRALWTDRLPEEITLEDLIPPASPPVPTPRSGGQWVVGAVLALALGFLAFLVGWLG